MDNTSPPPNLQQRSFIVRFFRSRILRGIVFVIFCLVTLAFLVLAEENWRGRRAWEKFRQEWEAKGERFDLASLIPKPVPPEQNFAMTPFLAPLLDYEFAYGAVRPKVSDDDFDVAGRTVRWRDTNGVIRAQNVSIYLGLDGGNRKSPSQGNWQLGQFCDLKGWQAFYRGNTNYPSNPQPGDPAHDVLFALQKYEPVLIELRAASKRPYANFPIHYDEGPAAVLGPHLAVLKALTQFAELRSLVNLDAGQSEEALADIKLAFHLAKSIQSEPLLISQLVRLSIVQISTQPIWEGLAKHRWTDAQLQELQKTLASFRLLEDYGIAMRGERAWDNEMMAQYRAGRVWGNGSKSELPKLIRVLMPTGALYQNQLVIDRLYQETTLAAVNAAQHRVYPEKCVTNVVASVLKKRTPYNILAWMLFPALDKIPERFARTQTSVDLATVACSLERYRLANNKYPEILGALSPQFIAKLPLDVINGQPLKYRLDETGQPVIYSVGWNETDDGGIVGLTRGSTPSVDPNKGDWVWQDPEK